VHLHVAEAERPMVAGHAAHGRLHQALVSPLFLMDIVAVDRGDPFDNRILGQDRISKGANAAFDCTSCVLRTRDEVLRLASYSQIS
jgi:hypothetical protein